MTEQPYPSSPASAPQGEPYPGVPAPPGQAYGQPAPSGQPYPAAPAGYPSAPPPPVQPYPSAYPGQAPTGQPPYGSAAPPYPGVYGGQPPWGTQTIASGPATPPRRRPVGLYILIGLLAVGLIVAALFVWGPLGSRESPPTPTASPTASGTASPSPTPAKTTTVSPTGPVDLDFPLRQPVDVYTQWTSPDRQEIANPDPAPVVPGMVSAPGGGIAGYLTQTFTWTDCPTVPYGGDTALPTQCATVLAPLDWHDPDAQAITLAIKRLPATEEPSLGNLYINPGGPGGSAQDYVESFADVGLERYTIVGVDPRGSGESTRVLCGSDAQTQAWFDLDGSPEDQAERDALLNGTKEFADQCRQSSGALLDHISTIEAIYDFEMIRRLLGDDRFNFLGVSYGTYIGSVYAELYPEHAGHLVLDAAVNITENESVSQSDGFELALHKFAQWCAADANCKSLGTSEAAVLATITGWLETLDSQPIPVGDRTLTQTLALTGIAMYLYLGADYYESMALLFTWAIEDSNVEYLLRAADMLNGMEDDGTYGTLALSFPAIGCIDGADRGVDYAWTEWQTDAERAPIFGRLMGPGLVCPVWTARPAPQIDFTGAGAPPLLVIGGTGDNATPYQYAEWMADQLESAVLVTRDGVGHGSFNSGNTCIDNLVRSFLLEGTVPADGTTC